jgi:hypothetical protein
MARRERATRVTRVQHSSKGVTSPFISRTRQYPHDTDPPAEPHTAMPQVTWYDTTLPSYNYVHLQSH